jgi:hypothetical protein
LAFREAALTAFGFGNAAGADSASEDDSAA